MKSCLRYGNTNQTLVLAGGRVGTSRTSQLARKPLPKKLLKASIWISILHKENLNILYTAALNGLPALLADNEYSLRDGVCWMGS